MTVSVWPGILLKYIFVIIILCSYFAITVTMRKMQRVNALEKTSIGKIHIITVGDNDYYVDHFPADRLHLLNEDDPTRPRQPSTELDSRALFGRFRNDLLPCTVLDWVKEGFDDKDIEELAADLARRDDVWTRDFFNVIILRSSKSVVLYLGQRPVIAFRQAICPRFPEGPYAIRPVTGEIFPVTKFHSGKSDAFIGGSLRFNALFDSFEWLNIGNRIAVPSRLHFKRTSERPLAGLRFAVKDIIDVAGVETGCGNRNYRSFYPPRPFTAPCIQRLLDAGAILVGKTKTSQFAESQDPSQWFDYLAPFNPRGDGYQKPSSSSTGSAVASATYPWLDFTLGTDTGGSIRGPAGVCGTYGMRPSTGAVSSAGVYSVSPVLDTVGVFARSAHVIQRVMNCMTEPSYPLIPPPRTPRKKYKLLYPIRDSLTKAEHLNHWFPYPGSQPGDDAATDTAFENVVQKIESHLNCSRTPFNIDDLWRQTHPAGQPDSLDDATGHIYAILTTYSSVRETIDPFIANFKAHHRGREPYFDPVVKARHERGREMTAFGYENAVKSAEVFGQWCRDVLFAPGTYGADGDEFPLLVFPQSRGKPDYRHDTSDAPPLFCEAFSTYSISYLAGAPDCTVPVDETPVRSLVTGQEMMLPCSLSVLSPPGTDRILLALLAEMEEKGILREVMTGERMFRGLGEV